MCISCCIGDVSIYIRREMGEMVIKIEIGMSKREIKRKIGRLKFGRNGRNSLSVIIGNI
jgi:hypothetical protein